MTVTVRDPRAPRSPGCEYGGHVSSSGKLSCYGDPGESCQADGCGTILRASNPYDVCSRCLGRGIKGRKRPPRRGGASDSGCGSVVADTASVPRRVTTQEVEMAAEARRKNGAAKEAVIDLMADGEWRGSSQVAARTGISYANAKYHLQRLTECGHLESDGKGGKGYRLRRDAAAQAAEAHCAVKDDAADCQANEPAEAPTAPPAPARGPDPEPPAKAAAASPLSGPPPFAGLASCFEAHGYSRAVRVLMDLDEMDPGERERVLQFAVSTWWLS